MASIRITGMSCGHCVASVREVLEKIEGVSRVKVDLATSTASYEATEGLDRKSLIEAVRAIGFGAE